MIKPGLSLVGQSLSEQDERVVSQVSRVLAIAGQQVQQLLASLGPGPIGFIKLNKEVLVVGFRCVALDDVFEAADRGPPCVSIIPQGQDFRLGANLVVGLIGRGQVRLAIVDEVQQLERLERPAVATT